MTVSNRPKNSLPYREMFWCRDSIRQNNKSYDVYDTEELIGHLVEKILVLDNARFYCNGVSMPSYSFSPTETCPSINASFFKKWF